MSVDSVMTEFNNDIRKNYELEIFDIIIPDADEETGTEHSCISLMIWKFQMANTKIF